MKTTLPSWLLMSAFAASALLVPTPTLAQTTCGNVALGEQDPCEDAEGNSPIRVSDGCVQRQVIDLQSFGGVGQVPLEFRRTYYSRYLWWARFTKMGRGSWRSNWDHNLYLQNNGNRYHYADEQGNGHIFTRVGTSNEFRTGQFADPSALVLWQWPSNPNRFTMVFPDGREMDFERVPSSPMPNFVRLTAIRDTQGNETTVSYIPGSSHFIDRVEDPTGRGLNFSYNSDGLLEEVSTDDGRFVQFNYILVDGVWAMKEAVYDDATVSSYTYIKRTEADGVTRPLLMTAHDVRYGGNKVGAFEGYDYNPSISGQVLREYNTLTGNTTIQIAYPLNAPRVITKPDGGVKYRKMTGVRTTEMTDAMGRVQKRAYSGHKLTSRTDARGFVTAFVTDPLGRPLQIIQPDGTSRAMTYNARGQVLTETDELGRTTTHTYDAQFRHIRTDYPDGTFEEWTHNTYGQILTEKDRRGSVTTHEYDSWGNRIKTTDALGNITLMAYDAAGRMISLTNARGHTTTMSYNAKGQILQITHPDGSFSTRTYDAVGNLIAETNELGQTTQYLYDEHNRLVQIIDPLLRTRTFEYGTTVGCGSCGAGQELVRFEWDAKGGLIQRHYDLAGQLLWVKDQTGAQTFFHYDPNGNLIQTVDANGRARNRTYNSRNWLLTESDPLGNTTTRAYNAVGNTTQITRPDGGLITQTYDLMNRMVSSTDPLSQTTTYAYDANGNLTSLTDAKGQVYLFTYDLLNRRTRFTYAADGSYEEHTFDPVGNPVTYRTRAGQVQTSTFDNRNREVSRSWSDSTPGVAKSYDLAGRLTSCQTVGVVTCSYTYDVAGQLLTETHTPAALGTPFTLTYTYDLNGNRASLVYPGGTVVEYSHNARNQVTSVTANGSPALATYAYDALGNRTTKTLENGTTTSYAYDHAARLLQILHSNSGGTLTQINYVLNAVGNRTRRTQDGSVDLYTHDATDQLTSVAYASGNLVNYTYDAVGNRIEVAASTTAPGQGTYTSNGLNQYTAFSGHPVAPTYDPNGNLTGANGSTFAYDARNRLTSATTPGNTLTATYDCQNRPISRTINGVTTYFIWDGWSLIEERNAAGTLTTTYVHGPVIDELLVKTTTSGSVYYHHDGLGSTVALTDAAGAKIESYTYDAFGTVSIFDAAGFPQSSSTAGNRFLFTGREFVKEANLYDYRNRVYSAELGRFLQTDPIQFEAGDVNLYRYVGNSPIMLTDPSGKISVPVFLLGAAHTLWQAVCGSTAMRKAREECSTDKGRHCYVSCWHNRCMLLFNSHVTAAGGVAWEFYHGWNNDSWSDLKANIKGIISSFNFSDCASSCCCK
jgi:RHS repeat-associated protein